MSIRYKQLNAVVLPREAAVLNDPCTRSPTACADATCDAVTFGLEDRGAGEAHAVLGDDSELRALERELTTRIEA